MCTTCPKDALPNSPHCEDCVQIPALSPLEPVTCGLCDTQTPEADWCAGWDCYV
jgi:hypothetical protein